MIPHRFGPLEMGQGLRMGDRVSEAIKAHCAIIPEDPSGHSDPSSSLLKNPRNWVFILSRISLLG